MLKVNPEKAMEHFGKPQKDVLRGCFEPREKECPSVENIHYREMRDAFIDSPEPAATCAQCLTATRRVVLSCSFVLACPAIVQGYVWTLLKDPCDEYQDWRCQKFKILDASGGACLTSASLVIILVARIAL